MMYQVTKLHTSGILAGISTVEETSVPFEVCEVIDSFTGGRYEVTAVEVIAE